MDTRSSLNPHYFSPLSTLCKTMLEKRTQVQRNVPPTPRALREGKKQPHEFNKNAQTQVTDRRRQQQGSSDLHVLLLPLPLPSSGSRPTSTPSTTRTRAGSPCPGGCCGAGRWLGFALVPAGAPSAAAVHALHVPPRLHLVGGHAADARRAEAVVLGLDAAQAAQALVAGLLGRGTSTSESRVRRWEAPPRPNTASRTHTPCA